MNMGLSTKLTFLKNRAIVNYGCTVVLHNNKMVQTGKGDQKRNVHCCDNLIGLKCAPDAILSCKLLR
jgi:hypothetical protein